MMALLKRWQRPRPGSRVIVVALHKSGTHLIARLLETLGYATTGEGIDHRRPHWSSGFDLDFLDKFPANTAFFMHSLPLEAVPVAVAEGWVREHEPRILFHYRDPRAMLASFVNYLLKRNAGGAHASSGYQTLIADLLEHVPEEECMAAVMKAFPQYVGKAFEDNRWLLQHARVCKTSFEELVGPAGNGSRAAQLRAIERVAQFLGRPRPEPLIADRLFDRQARTFFRGQVDGWRAAFSASDLAQFEHLYGSILDAYGYPRSLSEPPAPRNGGSSTRGLEGVI